MVSDQPSLKLNGAFVDMHGEQFYVIHDVDHMAPFFASVVSHSDLWLFISSTGGLTAGRVSPETALFPYVPVDQIHENWNHTGPKTLIRLEQESGDSVWEPFNQEQAWRYKLERNIYKSALGNKVILEEVNRDLGLLFRYCWMSTDEWGFVRRSELHNLSNETVVCTVVDGLQNILPAGVPRTVQTVSSNLVDAYKRTELDQTTSIATFSLYSGITDRAEPCESLKANTIFSFGLDDSQILISKNQFAQLKNGTACPDLDSTRGQRGDYFVHSRIALSQSSESSWYIVANAEQSQAQVAELGQTLSSLSVKELSRKIEKDIASGSDKLARIMANADAFQHSADRLTAEHHYSNVLFNNMRGGNFVDQYTIPISDFRKSLVQRNRSTADRHVEFLEQLPKKLGFNALLDQVIEQNDPQFERLCREYLPLTFGRRHGDPSRPWNQFAIKLLDEYGQSLLSYEGNWRDIFQNWEALALSYPEFIENMVTVFVNASTVDGYNPYRLTKEGIDWEVEDPEDPWSYIGYWGDHQIIYLLKLLEISQQFHPERLSNLLDREIFCYANVPYRIKAFADLLVDPKNTVVFDDALAEKIEERVSSEGADGKLLWGDDQQVLLVNLYEKLLVPMLSKLGNLVIDGGIWMNTQRPEWNDANNALVGQGLSMVTLYYMRRYVNFLQTLLGSQDYDMALSQEVADWLEASENVISVITRQLSDKAVSEREKYEYLCSLGEVASAYREAIYSKGTFSGKRNVSSKRVRSLLSHTQSAIDHSIKHGRTDDGLYHAYNLLNLSGERLQVRHLYPMLEGQVAALSSGLVQANEANEVITALFASPIYREDQDTFMLYPDRDITPFMAKNILPTHKVEREPLLQHLLKEGDSYLIEQDVNGHYRFNANIQNKHDLQDCVNGLVLRYGNTFEASKQTIEALYESVFKHSEFTGRSGGMFGFEGLGCVYWHMVSKLLLAVQESYFNAAESNSDRETIDALAHNYYRVRQGLGFNKTPIEFGAFPMDAYSHTPKHSGAQQPGMTGQVKEEIITRFGELGIRVKEGIACFNTTLLRRSEFSSEPHEFRYLNVENKWKRIDMPVQSLGFTWCQVPILYLLDDDNAPQLTIDWQNGEQTVSSDAKLSDEQSQHLFMRDGKIAQISLRLRSDMLVRLP